MEGFGKVDVLGRGTACDCMVFIDGIAVLEQVMGLYDHGGDLFGTARRMGADPEKLLDFSASINPLGMSDLVRSAIREAIDSLIHYPDPYSEPFRDAIAGYHGVSAEQIVTGNGSTELIFLLPRLIKNSRGLIVAPAFSEYAKSLTASGWEIHYHPLSPDDNFSLNLNELQEKLSGGYGMLFLCNPGNPTGRLYFREELLQVIELCRKAGTFLVLDEAFIDFCGESASLLKEMVSTGCGVVLRSLTKFYAIPGLRLGYAAASTDICRRLAEIRGPWSVNTLAQAAGLAAINDSVYRSSTLELVACERFCLSGVLSLINGLTPFAGAANYLLIAVDDRVSIELLCRELLLRFNLLVRDCSSFAGLEGNFIRVAVRSRQENRLLASSLQILLQELLPER